ncbi:MAG: PilZ domain-containing protein [Planctomycetota bacterium]|nr:PilZ domain-containing protein [Planctomycetota bacterium]
MTGTSSNSVNQIIDKATGSSENAEKKERRGQKRHPYELLVGLILVDEQGQCSDSIVLRAINLSPGGVCLSSRQALEPGQQGVVQLMRTNGTYALAGVEIRHCHYIEDQNHIVGLQFKPFPKGLKRESFLDEQGHLRLFDPLLKENIEG